MNKVLITGGAGFIGSHLTCTLQAKGYEVVVLDNLLRGNKIPKEMLSKIRFIQGDVTDKKTVMEAAKGCDSIYHLAAILGVDVVADNPTETMEVEVVGMMNIAEAALLNNSKIIYASTSGIYGHNAIEQSVTEDIMVDPRTSYAMAKRYNELYMAALHEEKGLNCIALRYFNVYGPRQDNRMVTPRFIEQAIAGKPLTVFGTGEQTRDFTYIDDTIKATILVGEKVNGFQIFNVANENEESILNLAKKIISISNSESTLAMIEAPKKRYDYEVGRRYGNSDKLKSFIDYKPDTPLDRGLKDLIKLNLNKGKH